MDAFLMYDLQNITHAKKISYQCLEFILNEVYGFRSQGIFIVPVDSNDQAFKDDLFLKTGYTINIDTANPPYFLSNEDGIYSTQQMPFYKAILCCRIIDDSVVSVLLYTIDRLKPQVFVEIRLKTATTVGPFTLNGFGSEIPIRTLRVTREVEYVSQLISLLIRVVPDSAWFYDWDRVSKVLNADFRSNLRVELQHYRSILEKVRSWVEAKSFEEGDRLSKLVKFFLLTEYPDVVSSFTVDKNETFQKYEIAFNAPLVTERKRFQFLHECCWTAQFVQMRGFLPDEKDLRNSDVLAYCSHYFMQRIMVCYTRMITYLELYAGIRLGRYILDPEIYFNRFKNEFKSYFFVRWFSGDLSYNEEAFGNYWAALAVWLFQTPWLSTHSAYIKEVPYEGDSAKDTSLFKRQKKFFLIPLSTFLGRKLAVTTNTSEDVQNNIPDGFSYLAAAPRALGETLKKILNFPNQPLSDHDVFDVVKYASTNSNYITGPYFERLVVKRQKETKARFLKHPCFFRYPYLDRRAPSIVVCPLIENFTNSFIQKSRYPRSITTLLTSTKTKGKVVSLGTARTIYIDVDPTQLLKPHVERVAELFKACYETFLFKTQFYNQTQLEESEESNYLMDSYDSVFGLIHTGDKHVEPHDLTQLNALITTSLSIFGV